LSNGSIILAFSGASAASRLVAGLPAAARALYEAAQAGVDRCTIAVPGGWTPDAPTREELVRLAGDMPFDIADAAELAASDRPARLLQGELVIGTRRLPVALAGGLAPRRWANLPRLSQAEAEDALDRASRAIIAGTVKPSDGIVSQLINRPISQTISRVVLRFPAVRPAHATCVSALTAVAMLAALLLGGENGLLIGAVLFQAASILDGVDGEIARATFRTSAGGAMADSLVDAVTNIGFIAGVVVNLWIRGHSDAAIAGSIGLLFLALGMFLIGRRARRDGGAFTFDGVKHHFNQRRSWLMQMLIWLTMRDFYALAWLAVIAAGAAGGGLVLFAMITGGWLTVVLRVLYRQAA
jgi:CDP-L-myo-inositol myo-inositolphosphotransferase